MVQTGGMLNLAHITNALCSPRSILSLIDLSTHRVKSLGLVTNQGTVQPAFVAYYSRTFPFLEN